MRSTGAASASARADSRLPSQQYSTRSPITGKWPLEGTTRTGRPAVSRVCSTNSFSWAASTSSRFSWLTMIRSLTRPCSATLALGEVSSLRTWAGMSACEAAARNAFWTLSRPCACKSFMTFSARDISTDSP